MKISQKLIRRIFLILSLLFLGLTVRGCVILNLIYALTNYTKIIPPPYNDITNTAYNGNYHYYAADKGIIYRFNYESMSEWEIDYTVPGEPHLLDIDLTFIPTRQDFILCVGVNGTIVKWNNSGWQVKNSTVNNKLNKIYTYYSSFSFQEEALIIGDEGTVLKSTDDGETWVKLNFPATCDLKDIGGNFDYVFVSGGPYCAYKTTDNGESWIQIPTGENPNAYGPNSFNTIHIYDDNVGYIGGPWGLMGKTTDGGINWEFFAAPDFEEINDLFFISPDSGAALGTNGIVRFTTDGGVTWFEDNSVTAFLNGETIKRIVPFGRNHGFVIGENGFDIFVAKDSTYLDSLTVVTNVEYEPEIVQDFQLLQNYPNPFNPSTIIEYSLPQYGFVTLIVYDMLGREIATLVNEEKPIGSYEVEFDAIGLTSGIYYYQIKIGNEFAETKKMVLLK